MAREDHSQSEWPKTPRLWPDDEPTKKTTKKKPKRIRTLDDKALLGQPRGRQTDQPNRYVPGIKDALKRAIFEDHDITLEELEALIRKLGAKVSVITVSNIRAETRHTLKLLDRDGWLRNTPKR